MAKKLPLNSHTGIAVKLFLLIGFGALIIALTPLITLPTISLSEEECANSVSCINNLSGAFEENATEGTYLNKIVSVPSYFAQKTTETQVLGDSTANKQIYIDLSSQHLYAFEDNKMVYDFPVSTGKWGATPTGNFSIWVKLRYTRMSGGNRDIGTYYDLPNVPYTMFFYNKDVPKTRGFGIHGAYWHNNFGHPMSHGCINMKEEDVAKIYNWADPPVEKHITYATTDSPGTNLIIYGETPKE